MVPLSSSPVAKSNRLLEELHLMRLIMRRVAIVIPLTTYNIC